MDSFSHHNQKTMTQIQTLMATISYIQYQVDNQGSGGRDWYQNGGGINGVQGSCDGGQGWHDQMSPTPLKYCWSHGWCTHSGIKCNSKDDGHIYADTASKTQGGITTNFNWLNSWRCGKVVNSNLNPILEYYLFTPQQHQTLTIAIVDTDANGHYLSPKDKSHYTNITPTYDGPSVQVGNVNNIKYSTRVQTSISSKLLTKSQEDHIFN